MTIVRGFCNKCGQCCGLDDGVPAFSWGLFDICRQYENSPDANISALNPAQVELYSFAKHIIGKKRVIRIGDRNFSLIVLADEKYGRRRGLVKSETETYCPFLDYEGTPDLNAPNGIAHDCLIWGKTNWQVQFCQGSPPWIQKVGMTIEGDEKEKAEQFFEEHPKCSFWLEAT